MQKIIQKITSRKFLAAAAGIVLGIAVVFGVDGDTTTTVAGAVTALASLMTYIITEGRIDVASVAASVEATQKAVEAIKGDKDG